MRYTLGLLLVLLLAGPTFGAGTTLEGDGRAYYVALFDPAAKCVIEEIGDTGVMEASCTAGDYVVTATTEWGCGESYGPTYCGSVALAGDRVVVANELRCGQNSGYVLSGGRGEVRCKGNEDAMRCQSPAGDDFAEATCAKGCGEVRGAGVCCIAGSTDCPPEIDIVQKE